MEDRIKLKKKDGTTKKRMTIRRQIVNGRTAHVNEVTVSTNGGSEVDVVPGDVRNLKIVVNGSEYPVVSIPDDTIIETEGSSCTWYFFGGRWWQFCL